MHVLVVGAGTAGRRHAGILCECGADVALCGTRNLGARAAASTPEGVTFFGSLDEALEWGPHAAVVATPAPFHVPVGRRLADRGVHLYIEKPFGVSASECEELLQLARTRNVSVTVGYNLRFDPALRALKAAIDEGAIGRVLHARAEVGQHLGSWRPGSDYRDSVTASAALGGGALMELSHEIDYVTWLFGAGSVAGCVLGFSRTLDADVEDSANLLLRCGDIPVAIHLDMIDKAPTRRLRVVGANGTAEWDAIAGCARVFTARNGWLELAGHGSRTAADRHSIAAFLEMVERSDRGTHDAEQAVAVMRIIENARACAEGQPVA